MRELLWNLPLDEGGENVELDLNLVKLLRSQSTLLEDGFQSVTKSDMTGCLFWREHLPLQLLGDIIVRLRCDLLHNVDVSFSLVTKSGCLFKKAGADIDGGVDKLLGDLIQGWKTASQIVETTSNGALSTAVFVQEINKRLLAPGAIVGNRVLLALTTLSKELDGGEGLDAIHHSNGLVVTRVSIHVGNDTVFFILEVRCDFLEDGFHRLAVSTPGGGESYKGVLGLVQCDRVEVVNGKRRDLRWGRWFDIRLEASLVGDTMRGG